VKKDEISGRRERLRLTEERARNLDSAIELARRRTDETKIEHEVRDDGVRYYVVPARRPEYALLGKLVSE
jgi:hypothetical protein